MAHLRLIHDNKLTAVAGSAIHPATNDYKSLVRGGMGAGDASTARQFFLAVRSAPEVERYCVGDGVMLRTRLALLDSIDPNGVHRG